MGGACPAFAAQLTKPLDAAPGTVTITATRQRFQALQAAVDALPESGGEITLSPGVYREKVLVTRSKVRLRGLGRKPDEVVIAWSDGARRGWHVQDGHPGDSWR